MRAGLNTIQQTLTPEAAGVLNQSIAEATRRNHGQTTPLHVAATLLSSPSGYLRQACIRSHPHSSHPLQCRALELCFSVALERLPTAQNPSPNTEPPISNALMAALKRAQAHQRRGCPEQQQQPLLAVKVELEQLIISILDDPSVSRVMREASFSSPAVKATIEQSLTSLPSNNTSSSIGLGFRPAASPSPIIPSVSGRNLYLNPRLQQQQQGNAAQSGQQRAEEEVKKVMDILSKARKGNPVLVGETEPEAVMREVLRRIEMKEVGEGPLNNVVVISMDKEPTLARLQMPAKTKELGHLIEGRLSIDGGEGVLVDMGNLKWLVDQPPAASSGVAVTGGSSGALPQGVSEAVAEMGKLLNKFGETTGEGNRRLWLIGTATCETYLRCQIYHPTMENDWDLQVRSIAARAPLPGIFPRIGSNGIISCSSESFSPMKSLPIPTAAPPPPMRIASDKQLDPCRRLSCCPQCLGNYEQELAKTVNGHREKSASQLRQEAARQQLLPQWLQSAKLVNTDQKGTNDLPLPLPLPQSGEQELILIQKSQQVQKKWAETCLRLHPSFHNKPSLDLERMIIPSTPLSSVVTSMCNPNLLSFQPLKPKLQLAANLGEDLQLNINSGRPTSPPATASPVTTDLVLGRRKTSAESTTVEKGHQDRVKDFLGGVGCISSETPRNKFSDIQSARTPLAAAAPDVDSFKTLLKGLMEKVWWQREAASALATTVTQCRVGNGKPRAAAGSSKGGDLWLLFSGPDRIGKKKMAGALSELVCGGDPVTIYLGSSTRVGEEESSDLNFRGKTVIDRIAEAVRRNPFSVIVLQDIDEANVLVCGSIRRAMERGRLADSHGREISLGNVIFILTASSMMPENFQNLSSSSPHLQLNEDKLTSLASGGWQLRLSVVGDRTTGKRRANWQQQQHDEDRVAAKKLKEMGPNTIPPSLSFDLNQMADTEDDRLDGSRNSSDLTFDHDQAEQHGHHDHPSHSHRQSPPSAAWHELFESWADDAMIIFFKPVDFGPIRCNIESTITTRFSTITGNKLQLEVDEDALEKIMAGIWLGQIGLDAWVDKVLVPTIQKVKASLPTCACACAEEEEEETKTLAARLELDRNCDSTQSRSRGDWLPSRITVAID
ncbi:hypothetical protein Dimus_002452 [Dionaea muscipula]